MQVLVTRWFWPALFALLYVGLSALTLTPKANGQSCGTGHYNNVVVKKEVVVVKEVAAIVTPVVTTFVQIPLYTAVYIPAYAPPAYAPPVAAPAPHPQSAGGEMREVLSLLKGMDTRLRKLEGGAPPMSNPPLGALAPGTEGIKALSSKCASCHNEKSSADAGGGFKMFEGGNLVALSDKQIRRILTRTQKGTMPPPKSGIVLSDEEASAIVNTFDR